MGRSSNRRAATRRGLDRRLLGAARRWWCSAGSSASRRSPTPIHTPDPRSASTAADKQVNGLTILTNTCADSQLAPHDGFQNGDRCVSTEFGEVGSAANNPSLLITEAPRGGA